MCACMSRQQRAVEMHLRAGQHPQMPQELVDAGLLLFSLPGGGGTALLMLQQPMLIMALAMMALEKGEASCTSRKKFNKSKVQMHQQCKIAG